MQFVLAIGLSALLATVHGQILFPGSAPGNTQQGQSQPSQQQFQPQPRPQPQQQGQLQQSPGLQGGNSLPQGGIALNFREDDKQQIPCVRNGQQGTCHPMIECATFSSEIEELQRSPCQISQNVQGVCCLPDRKPTTGSVGGSGAVKTKLRFPAVPVPNVGNQQVNVAVRAGLRRIKEKENIAQNLVSRNIVAERGSSAQLHSLLFPTSDNILDISKEAEKLVQASVNLVQEFNLTNTQGSLGLPSFSAQDSEISNTCPSPPVCHQTLYRSMDGSCNNLRNKDWGKAGTAQARLMLPEYLDGVNSPRIRSRSGVDLPSPRLLSSSITVEEHNPYRDFTVLIMQWGQFLDHDITHTPITKGGNNGAISCCDNGQFRQPGDRHPACLPIQIPHNDPFYARHRQICMEFVRSLPAIRPNCNFGPREQMNQISAFIDGSNVYGSSDSAARDLRSFRNGLLKIQFDNGRSLLPKDERACRNPQTNQACFKAGDGRVNEQPNLVVMHTIWMRQHNLVATELKRINQRWNDEQVYQEARRVVIAQMQHITYNEYLPIVLGKEYMLSFGLQPLRNGFSNAYKDEVDPSINNAFAAAAFRYGHTLVGSTMKSFAPNGFERNELELSKNQFAPFMLYNRGTLDDLLRGLAKQPSEKFDRFFSRELTNKLFAGSRQFGMDLVALNIQRGRDHGLPDYNSWREFCGLTKAVRFDDLREEISPQVIGELQNMYASVDDIDLFIGGIAENKYRKTDSLLGPTFLCIVGDQFARLKLGDRFYYEYGGMPNSFTGSQLNEIRKTSLSRIMCDNSDDMQRIQPLAFTQPSQLNNLESCSNLNRIPRTNLDVWRN